MTHPYRSPESVFLPPLPTKRVTQVQAIKAQLTTYWQSVDTLVMIWHNGKRVGRSGERRLREMTGDDTTHINYDPEVEKTFMNGAEHYRLKNENQT